MLAALLALAVPLSLSVNMPPSATLVNQACAWFCWGVFAGLGTWGQCHGRTLGRASMRAGRLMRRIAAVLMAGVLAYLLLAFDTPPDRRLWNSMSVSVVVAAALTLSYAASSALSSIGSLACPTTATWPAATKAALLVAACVGSFTGLLQVFAPNVVATDWIAAPTTPGRATGNLRQPNHLATVLLWGVVAAAWLHEEVSRRPAILLRGLAGATLGLLLLGLVLTASRTGAAGVLVLAAWGLLDRRLSRTARVALVVSPLVYAAIWWIVDAAVTTGGSTFAGTQRLTQEGLSTSRWAIWANTLELIRMHPWTGVGVGEFNFAWTLTEFSTPRPLEFFDHSHNLVLQLWVELGLPLGSLVLALLGYALWRAFRAPAYAPDARTALTQRCAFMIVLLALMHSMLEYPLWYAHFLFPVAFFWGVCLARPQPAVPAGVAPAHVDGAGAPTPSSRTRRSWGTLATGAALMAGGVLMLVDYLRVVPIYDPPAQAAPLRERIAHGQRSWFFAHHADYALVTTYQEPLRTLEDFERPTHHLLDARLMQAWAEALAAAGEVDRARWVARRLAEFRRPTSHAFFAPCKAPAADGASRPFQCEAPTRRYTFEDFR